MKGDLTLYADLSRYIDLPAGLISHYEESFNVPVINYKNGSYFGDFDTLVENDNHDHIHTRVSTCEASNKSEILAISKK